MGKFAPKLPSIAIACAVGAFLALPTTAALAQQWAAIAIDGKGRYGYAYGKPTRPEAENGALKGCGQGCKLELAGQARCIAFVESRKGGYWYGTGFGPSEDKALATAKRGCEAKAPAGTCATVKSGCN
jgi:hypothetical protein